MILLQEHGEITFGINRLYRLFDQTAWRSTYYDCEDELNSQSQQMEINAVEAKARFIPIELKWCHDVSVKDACNFHLNYDEEKRYPFSFSTDIAHQLDCCGTVPFTCMQLAAYMGFSEIYLLGVDHNYQKTIDIYGNIMIDSNARGYFCEGYDDDIKDAIVHDMGNKTRAYLDSKAYCDQH